MYCISFWTKLFTKRENFGYGTRCKTCHFWNQFCSLLIYFWSNLFCIRLKNFWQFINLSWPLQMIGSVVKALSQSLEVILAAFGNFFIPWWLMLPLEVSQLFCLHFGQLFVYISVFFTIFRWPLNGTRWHKHSGQNHDWLCLLFFLMSTLCGKFPYQSTFHGIFTFNSQRQYIVVVANS